MSDAALAVAAVQPVVASERRIAEILAGSDLPTVLRFRSDGPTPGWQTWNGRTWGPSADRIPHVLQGAVHTIAGKLIAAGQLTPPGARSLESAGGIRGIAALLSAWPQVAWPAESDPPGLLATPGGVLDLHTGELMPHDPGRFITRCCAVNADSASPLWPMVRDHLAACLGDTLEPVRRFLGSALLGRSADRRLVWLHGPGGDGKSTLAAILRHALGSYFASVPSEYFLEQGARGAHGHELGGSLPGSRLAVAVEVKGSLDWAKIKALSGGDPQVTKRLHGRAFTYDRPPCLLLIANEAPHPPDQASAERLIVGELRPPVDPDERLHGAVAAPGPERDALAAACLGWLLRGARDYLAHGLGPCPEYGVRLAPGLADWWQSATAAGRIIPGKGWSPLSAARDDLAAYLHDHGLDIPHDRELAAFMRNRVGFKRTEAARLYGFIRGG